MTQEQLEKGKVLLEKIQSLKKHISFLQKAKEINDGIHDTATEISSGVDTSVKIKYWDREKSTWVAEHYPLVEDVKTMMINTMFAKHQTDLSILQTEFNSL